MLDQPEEFLMRDDYAPDTSFPNASSITVHTLGSMAGM